MQDSQHHDPSRDARQLPRGVILALGTGGLRSVPSHATKPLRGGVLGLLVLAVRLPGSRVDLWQQGRTRSRVLASQST